jgi:tetratricopeptide (TPR) repeat protein
MERAFAVISADEPDEDLAQLAARLSLGYWYSGDLERAAQRAELALDIAEAHAYPAALALALRAKAAVAHSRGHIEEPGALVRRALEIALEHNIEDEAGTCFFWLSDRCFMRDEYGNALGYLDESLALARKRGDRPREWAVLAERTYPLFMLGRWDEAQSASDEFTQEQLDAGGLMLSLLESSVEIHLNRGELEGARRIFSMFSRLEESTDVQELSCYLGSRAALHRAEGRLHDALADGKATIEVGRTLGIRAQSTKQGIVEAVEAALALGEASKVEELLALVEGVPPGSRPPYLDAQARRFRAHMDGDPSSYEAAAERFRHLSLPFWLAVTLLEHGELTGDASLLAEAREIFERLEATPWLKRLDAVAPTRAEVPA